MFTKWLRRVTCKHKKYAKISKLAKGGPELGEEQNEEGEGGKELVREAMNV